MGQLREAVEQAGDDMGQIRDGACPMCQSWGWEALWDIWGGKGGGIGLLGGGTWWGLWVSWGLEMSGFWGAWAGGVYGVIAGGSEGEGLMQLWEAVWYRGYWEGANGGDWGAEISFGGTP